MTMAYEGDGITFPDNRKQVAPALTGFRNYIINGGFDIWQRGTSQTDSGFGSDDRWKNSNGTSTKTHSRQEFTLGQTDVPGNPRYYSRTVVITGGTSSSFTQKLQLIESARTLAGKTVTLSFYAKADSTKNIVSRIIQNFGTGGTPSEQVIVTIVTHSLTTSWQKFTVTVDIPSIVGKTLGTDNNDSLIIAFWLDAGSDYNDNSNSLGNQSGTFDLANIQLEEGSIATDFEQRPTGLEFQLCQRYYQLFVFGFTTNGTGSVQYLPIIFPVVLRTTPTSTFSGIIDGDSSGYVPSYIYVITNKGGSGVGFTTAVTTGKRFSVLAAIDAEL